jgi:hypothetical protein
VAAFQKEITKTVARQRKVERDNKVRMDKISADLEAVRLSRRRK